MTEDKNIKHDFDLKGLSIGNSFLGCTKCWFRYDPHTGAVLQCPECGKLKMSLFTITEKDKDLL